MYNLKFIGALGLSLALSFLTSITVLAFSSPSVSPAPDMGADYYTATICPCPLHTDTNDGLLDDGNGGGNDEGDGSGSSGGGGDGGSGGGRGRGSNNNGGNENNCEHINRCPVCGDCLDCGNDPCPECCGDGRWCDDCFDCITREEYPGSIRVVINDDLLRIGSVLSFTASSDSSKYYIQWRVGGKNVSGANGLTYTVRPGDVDKKISVNLITQCKRYEGTSPETDYVPYTIKLLENDKVALIGDDTFYFYNEDYEDGDDKHTAYAASVNNAYVDIEYFLHDSDFGTDLLEFSLDTLSSVDTTGEGQTTYKPLPAHASNGVITIIVTFYHLGIDISPNIPFTFDGIECSHDIDQLHTITITNIGNAPTGEIRIEKDGFYPNQFTIGFDSIESIKFEGSIDLDVRVILELRPKDAAGYTYGGLINISGDNVRDFSVPVSVKVDHSWGQWSAWENTSETHHTRSRACTVCDVPGTGSDTHDYSNWESISSTQHSGSCKDCSRPVTENHNDNASTAWSMIFLGYAYGGYSTDMPLSSQCQRTPGCSDCGYTSPAPQIQGHRYGGCTTSSSSNGFHYRTCSSCGYVHSVHGVYASSPWQSTSDFAPIYSSTQHHAYYCLFCHHVPLSIGWNTLDCVMIGGRCQGSVPSNSTGWIIQLQQSIRCTRGW